MNLGIRRVSFFLCNMLLLLMVTCACAQQEVSYTLSTPITGLNNPFGVAVSPLGEIYVADTVNHRIIKRDISGVISTFAGIGGYGYNGDGILATSAQLSYPYGVVVQSDGEVIIADSGNSRIRKISTLGYISTLVGNGIRGYGGDGGEATFASLHYPYGVTIAPGGEIYISDTFNFLVREIRNGTITSISGLGGNYGDNISALSAKLECPGGVTMGPRGELYIADTNSHKIRKIVNGTITTVAGSVGGGYNGDGINARSALLNYPFGVAVLATGEVVFTDTSNHRVRKISLNGTISTIAGIGIPGYNGISGLATNVMVNSPSGIAIGPNHEIYFTDNYNNVIRKLVPFCPVGTLIGGYCESCGFLNCSGHGSCVANNCSCFNGYYGENCEYTFTCYGFLASNTSVCSGNGVCMANDTCSCSNGYSGFNCSQSFYCNGIHSPNNTVCLGHGKCVSMDNCSCTDGYYGNNCEHFYCSGIQHTNSSVCSTRGNCSSLNTCTCELGYYGSNCEKYDCNGYLNTDPKSCSNHGTCISSNNCTCIQGYYDPSCSSFDCAGEKFTNQSLCQNNGTCFGPGNCICPIQFGGSRCEYNKCYSLLENDPNVCAGHGACRHYNQCSCYQNWFGNDCSVTTCFNNTSNSSSVCNGRGNCTDFDKCVCKEGYNGNQCQNTICYEKIDSDSMVCSGTGKCSSPNNCTCMVGYIGNECQYHEMYLNMSSAIVHSYYDGLLKILPYGNEIFTCSEIFDETELAKLGESSSVNCQWRRNSFKIYLGFDYSLKHESILKTKFNFAMKILSFTSTSASEETCSFGYSLTENTPLSDIIVRLNCDENMHSFQKIKTSWKCDKCNEPISNQLSYYSNKSAIYIPVSYLNSLNPVQGYRIFSLQASYLTSQSIGKSISKDVKVQTITKSLPPSYYWLSDNYAGKTYSCMSHNCILEASLNSLNSSLSYSFSGLFSLLNPDLNSKQMARMINVYSGDILDSEYNSNMQVFGVQLKTYVSLPLTIEEFFGMLDSKFMMIVV